MQRRWTCILLAIGLILALAWSTALAEGEPVPVFRFDNSHNNIPIVPEEARDVITAADWINGMTVENLDELISAYGETIPSWSFELLDGEDVEAYAGEHEMDHAVLHFGRQPENDGDFTYRVSCDWNGHVGTNEITFTAATLPRDNLPTGNTLQPLYVTGAGETLTVVGDFLPSGWQVPGREDEWYFGLWEYDFTHQNPEDYTITEIDPTTVTFSSDKPGIYVLNGFISRGGVYGGQGVCILVTGDDSPVHISVQPGTNVLTCEQYTVAAAAPGAEAMRMYCVTQEYLNQYGLDGDANLREVADEIIFWDDASNYSGDWVYAACALLDGEWTDPWDCMLTVNVDAPNGELTGELLFLSALEIQPMESIDITIHQIDNAESVGHHMWGDHDAYCPELDMDEFGTATVYGGDLVPGGIYYVVADAMAQGYEHCWQMQTFMVNYEEAVCVDDPNSTLTIRTPGTELDTFTDHPFTLYAPGANQLNYIIYRVNDEGDLEEESNDYCYSCGAYVPDRLNRRYPDAFVLKARACYGDPEDESAWTNFDDCQITFTINNPYGWLDEAHAWTYMLATQGPDTPMDVYFEGNENAQYYGYWYRMEDNGDWLGGDSVWVDENTEFPIVMQLPTDEMQPGALYRIMFDVDAPGYTEGHRESLFIVGDNPDPNVTLTVPDSLNFAQGFEVHVDAPGADDVIIYTSIDGERRCWGYNEEEGYTEGYNSESVGAEGGTIWIWAAAHIDGSWNHVTECVAIPVPVPLGQVEAPAFSLSNTDVLRGDFVKATLGAVSQEADNYRVFFCNEEGQWYGDFGRGDAGDIYIPTANLPAGTYSVHGYVRAEGYLNGESEEDLTFTVNNPDDYPGGLYVLNPELITGEKLVWSLYAKGADHVALCVTGDPETINWPEDNWWCDRDGDWMYAEDWQYDHLNYIGDYYAYIGAHFGNEDGGWWDFVSNLPDFAPVELHASAPYGYLDDIINTWTFMSAEQGNNIEVHLENCENVQEFNYWYCLEDDREYLGGDGLRIDENTEQPVVMYLPTDDLQPGSVYRIVMDANGYGFNACHRENLFIVEGAPDENIAFTTPDSLIYGQDFEVHVDAPGADDVIIYTSFNGECRSWGYNEEEGYSEWYTADWFGMDGATIWVWAAAHIDGSWNHVTECRAIPVAPALGQVDSPSFSLTGTSVRRGNIVKATLGAVSQDATDYRVFITNSSGDWFGDYGRGDPGVIYIPTYNLPAGTYKVHGYVRAEGYINGETAKDLTFKVTSPSTYKGGLYVVNPDLQTGEKLIWGLYAKGADQVALCITDDPDRMDPEDNWWVWEEDAGAFEQHWLYTHFNHPGVYYAYAAGHFHNKTGDWWECVGTPVELHVTAPYGEAPVPEIEYAQLTAVDEDFVFTVKPENDAISYDVQVVWDGDWSSPLLWENNCHGERTFTLDKQFIDTPDSFVIHIWAYDIGYAQNYRDYIFRAEYAPGSGRVTVTADTYDKLFNEGDVWITVSAPGAEQVRLCNCWGEFDWADGDFLERGVRDDMVYAQALIDGEWYTSEALCINWISYGECGVSEPVLAETNVTRGQLLTVEVPEAELAEWYSVQIRDDDWNEYYSREMYAPGVYVLPTDNLTPDREYFVIVKTGAVGYYETENDRNVSRFTVTEPEEAVLALEKTEVLSYEDIIASVYAPGAERVRVSNCYLYFAEDDPGWYDEYGWDGDCWHDVIGWNWTAYETTVRAEGLYDGEWRLIGEETVYVTAPNGLVPLPEIEFSPLTAVDEDFVFTVCPTDDLIYRVSVVWDGDWSFDLLCEDDCRGERTFAVDKQYIDNPDTFVLRVWSRYEDMLGYEQSYRDYRFRSEYNPGSGRVTLSVEKTEALVNEAVEVTISAPGAEQVALCSEWGDHEFNDGDYWERSVDWDVIYAQALIDGEWYTSGAVVIHRTSYGQCGAASATLEKTSLTRGEPLAITVSEAEHAEMYHIRIRDDDWNEYYLWCDDAPRSYWLPTGNLEPGKEYFVIVSTAGRGYDWVDSDRNTATRFTVTGPETSLLWIEKTELLTLESVHTSICIPGAERIRFSGFNWQEDYPEWWESEDGWEGDWRDFDCEWPDDAGDYTVAAEGMFNGEWSGEVLTKTIHVTAPNGRLDEAHISAEPYQYIQDGLSFDVTIPDGAAYYYVEVWENIGNGERVWKLNDCTRYNDDSFYVPSSELELGHTYVIYTNTRGYGYECHEMGVEVTMVEHMTAPEFSLSTHAFIIDAGARMTCFATFNGQPMDRFLLELDFPDDHWTEYWCVYDCSYGWGDNSTPCFPWGTETEGTLGLRIAACNEDGQQTGPWSQWEYFDAYRLDVENLSTSILPASMRTIRRNAVANTGVEIIHIPEGVTEIQSRSFADCGNLMLVVFDGSEEITIAEDAFADSANVIFVAEEHSPAWHWALDHDNTMTK